MKSPLSSSRSHPATAIVRLNESVAKIEAALQAIGTKGMSGIYIKDSLSTGYWAPEVCSIFQFERAEKAPPLDAWAPMVPRADLAHIVATAQKAQLHRHQLNVQYRLRLRNGSEKLLRSKAMPVHGLLGHVCSLVGVVTDVTVEAHALAAVQAAAEEFRGVYGAMPATQRRDATPNTDCQTARISKRVQQLPRGALTSYQLGRILRLIEERVPTKFNVAEMAREVGLSRTWFARVFKEITGETPHQFILRRRLELASRALHDHRERNIAGIAAEFGFFDQSHFTRQFRRKFGRTPGEFLARLDLNQDGET
jgi:AraC-like DNA-binding protein